MTIAGTAVHAETSERLGGVAGPARLPGRRRLLPGLCLTGFSLLAFFFHVGTQAIETAAQLAAGGAGLHVANGTELALPRLDSDVEPAGAVAEGLQGSGFSHASTPAFFR